MDTIIIIKNPCRKSKLYLIILLNRNAQGKSICPLGLKKTRIVAKIVEEKLIIKKLKLNWSIGGSLLFTVLLLLVVLSQVLGIPWMWQLLSVNRL